MTTQHHAPPKRTATAKSSVRLQQEIERSRNILQLKDDWDSEGSSGYDKAVWQRATGFLRRYARRLSRQRGVVMPTPQINPGPDGSIDVHWKTRQFELLLNFPSDPASPAGFYGDDYGSLKIKGKMRTEGFNQGLLLWLMKHR